MQSGPLLIMPLIQKFGSLAIWVPFVLSLLSVYILTFPVAANAPWLKQTAANVYAASLVWFVIQAGGHFFSGRTASGLGMLALVVVLIGALLPFFIFGQIAAGQQAKSSDGFVDSLNTPAGPALTEPKGGAVYEVLPGGPADLFQTVMRSAPQQSTAAQARLPLGVPSLAKLRAEHPALLDRYLASHPAWRVYEEGGSRFAVRRWMNGNRWEMAEHGIQSIYDDQQTRLRFRAGIAFSGRPWMPLAQRITQGVLADIKAEPVSGSDLWKSSVAVPEGDLLVEMMEETRLAERRMTPAAFAMLENEFATLLTSTEWTQASRRLSAGAIQTSKPSIELRKSHQPGMYHALIRCNPGTAGRVYIKAYPQML